MTTAPSPAWYDSHLNLLKLAEWIRDNNGWAFFEKNALDILEQPWKWDNEWRLASGAVEFEPIERHVEVVECCGQRIEFTANATSCAWCQTLVGLVTFDSEFGPEEDWIVAWVDTKSGDIACDECAGQAANFSPLATVTPIAAAAHPADDEVPAHPELTEEMREHFRAFDHTEVFLVYITQTVTTELGNVLIPEGEIVWGANNMTWVERFNDGFKRPPSFSVWTKHTHYAGCSTSSVPVIHCMRLPETTVLL